MRHPTFSCNYGVEADFVSSAPFIPNQNTPYEKHPCGDVDLALNTMAIWRIPLGTPLIPAVSALEKLRPDGQLHGLNAGANVLTINFTPSQCREKYTIYSKQTFVVSIEHALKTIERAGLTRSSGITSPPRSESWIGDSNETTLPVSVPGVVDPTTPLFGSSDVRAAV